MLLSGTLLQTSKVKMVIALQRHHCFRCLLEMLWGHQFNSTHIQLEKWELAEGTNVINLFGGMFRCLAMLPNLQIEFLEGERL